MAKKRPITVWYDREGDFLEVLFERKPGYFRQTSSEAVMEKVDNQGNVIGFHVQHATPSHSPGLNLSFTFNTVAKHNPIRRSYVQ